MTDKADEIAREIWDKCGNIHGVGAGYNQIALIARSLHSYRNDGLDEAVRVIKRERKGWIHLARSVASLKSKEHAK